MAILKERRTNERRVAASPDTVKKYRGLGLEVVVETRAGDGASIPDKAFADAGAEIAPDAASACADADVVLKVRHPMTATEGNDELALMKRGAVLIGILNPYGNRDMLPTYAEAGVAALAMELVPRITRAQSMDVLSSQANLAGYRAVVDAASELPLIGCPSAAPCSSPFYAASPVSSLQYGPAWPPPWEATWRGAFLS
jgi:H+-translocating NAD(P) transhydrogenase subunit alpha